MSRGSAFGQAERCRKGEPDGGRLVAGLEFPVDAALPMLIVGISALGSRTVDPITDCGLMAKSRNQLPKIFIIATELVNSRGFHAAGRGFLIREEQDCGDGRVATDVCEGDRLDHGFQVLPTAYPEGLRRLDHNALELRRSYPTVRKGEFARRNFVVGDTAIPARGLAEIPRQPAAAGLEDLP